MVAPFARTQQPWGEKRLYIHYLAPKVGRLAYGKKQTCCYTCF